ncbi:MAG: helix-turn-helix domain-containing protein [Firmicutes bacterium]|nr:helix-turn-helix domain-containing protein [Bacillota bacterium]
MTRAIKIENLTKIDATSAQILRVISLHLGADSAAFVDYKTIAKSLNMDRDTVRKAINRMIKNRILKIENGKLSIPNAVILN